MSPVNSRCAHRFLSRAFRRRSGGLASQAGRRYDVIKVELSDHTERTLYFDITDFYGREKKPQ